ncbi:MAG: hypothetical protein JSS98_17755 [Bacteroidetes bacterium]|nr:hypothetical protein [Bacteroidota bacterium]
MIYILKLRIAGEKTGITANTAPAQAVINQRNAEAEKEIKRLNNEMKFGPKY